MKKSKWRVGPKVNFCDSINPTVERRHSRKKSPIAFSVFTAEARSLYMPATIAVIRRMLIKRGFPADGENAKRKSTTL